VDNNVVRISFARLKSKIFRQKIYFKKEDIFQTDLGKANIIYTYLWYDLMPPLEEKLKNELRKGTIVITNTSSFPNWQPKEIHIVHPEKPDFEELFVTLITLFFSLKILGIRIVKIPSFIVASVWFGSTSAGKITSLENGPQKHSRVK